MNSASKKTLSSFRYPKQLHSRRLSPGPFTQARQYINALQEEFYGSCVYCMVPDGLGITFEVEHYRPESRFPKLATKYSNLFYACRTCNGRKGKKWKERRRDAEFIVNPCDDRMTQHLRFRGSRVDAQSTAGEFTSETLQLNDDEALKVRERFVLAVENTLATLKTIEENIRKLTTISTNDPRRSKADAARVDFQKKHASNLDFLRSLLGRDRRRI